MAYFSAMLSRKSQSCNGFESQIWACTVRVAQGVRGGYFALLAQLLPFWVFGRAGDGQIRDHARTGRERKEAWEG